MSILGSLVGDTASTYNARRYGKIVAVMPRAVCTSRGRSSLLGGPTLVSVSPGEKPCKRCGIVKPLDAFSKHPSPKDGRFGSCKACEYARQKERRATPEGRDRHNEAAKAKYRRLKDRPYPAPSVTEKRCTGCLVLKPAAEFYPHRVGAGGLTSRCKPCEVKRASGWNGSHPESRAAAKSRHWQTRGKDQRREYLSDPEVRERYRLWKQANNRNREARKKVGGGTITSSQWQQLCERYGYRCLSCGRTDLPLTLDHVVPLARGGSHSIENAQPLCQPCNSRKSARVIDYRLVEVGI